MGNGPADRRGEARFTMRSRPRPWAARAGGPMRPGPHRFAGTRNLRGSANRFHARRGWRGGPPRWERAAFAARMLPRDRDFSVAGGRRMARRGGPPAWRGPGPAFERMAHKRMHAWTRTAMRDRMPGPPAWAGGTRTARRGGPPAFRGPHPERIAHDRMRGGREAEMRDRMPGPPPMAGGRRMARRDGPPAFRGPGHRPERMDRGPRRGEMQVRMSRGRVRPPRPDAMTRRGPAAGAVSPFELPRMSRADLMKFDADDDGKLSTDERLLVREDMKRRMEAARNKRFDAYIDRVLREPDVNNARAGASQSPASRPADGLPRPRQPDLHPHLGRLVRPQAREECRHTLVLAKHDAAFFGGVRVRRAYPLPKSPGSGGL